MIFQQKKSFISLEILEMWKKNKNKISPDFSKKNNICQNSQERSVREIGTLARVLSWKFWLKNVILVRKRFLMVPQLESISWCLFQKIREEIAFHVGGLIDLVKIILLTKHIASKISWYFLIWGTCLKLYVGMARPSFETSFACDVFSQQNNLD